MPGHRLNKALKMPSNASSVVCMSCFFAIQLNLLVVIGYVNLALKTSLRVKIIPLARNKAMEMNFPKEMEALKYDDQQFGKYIGSAVGFCTAFPSPPLPPPPQLWANLPIPGDRVG